MPKPTQPKLPIPDSLRGSDADSFAHFTVTVRLSSIARRVLEENNFPPAIAARLESFIADIPNAPIRRLKDSAALDIDDWERYTAPYLGQNWLEVPWFFGETYFYRRILEATGYFESGETQGVDPFARQKRLGLETSVEAIQALSQQVADWLKQPARRSEVLTALLAADLWGNQADLCMWVAGGEDQPGHTDDAQAQAHIMVNHSEAVVAHLCGLAGENARVDFIVDNAGFELIGDLALTDFLLSSGIAATVKFHLKPYPTFVSDATIKDVRQTLLDLTSDDNTAVRAMAKRLQKYLNRARFCLLDDWFWVSPLPLWEMPAATCRTLAQADLLISKGDANYRRLLGDCHWPFTAHFDDIAGYMPAPLVALRTAKSEVMAGLQPEQVADMDKNDPDWLVNGKWGVIQFVLSEG